MQTTASEMRISDWSSDVCSSDLAKVIEFKLAAGNAGIEAATNQSIESYRYTMLFLVYAVVIILCLIAFRSWRAMLCIVIPLGLTSLLCEALMVWMNMGMKVATLQVIALGVGIGVDYGIYIFAKLSTYQIGRAACRERVGRYV